MAYDNQGQRVLIAPPAPGAPRGHPNCKPNWVYSSSSAIGRCGDSVSGRPGGCNYTNLLDSVSLARPITPFFSCFKLLSGSGNLPSPLSVQTSQ
jgi:hypothetical protein